MADTPTPERTASLSDEKAAAEIEKLKAETAKLNVENARSRRLWSPAGIMSGVVSVAAVVVSGAQVWMANTAQVSADRRVFNMGDITDNGNYQEGTAIRLVTP